jgi:hypothetical protein
MKASEMFAMEALILLGFALVARFINTPALGISITWRGTGYVLPPGTISIALATALCVFATIYSLWMLPFSRIAMQWHFWVTSIGIVVFLLAFYRAGSALPDSRTAIWVVFVSPAVVLLSQVIFVWNLLQAIFKMPRLHS